MDQGTGHKTARVPTSQLAATTGTRQRCGAHLALLAVGGEALLRIDLLALEGGAALARKVRLAALRRVVCSSPGEGARTHVRVRHLGGRHACWTLLLQSSLDSP